VFYTLALFVSNAMQLQLLASVTGRAAVNNYKCYIIYDSCSYLKVLQVGTMGTCKSLWNSLWNSLLHQLQELDISFNRFKTVLKTFLF